MCDSLAHLANVSQSLSVWDSILPVLFAFIGGGLVTLLVDLVRNARRNSRVRRLIKSEIKMNLDVMDSQTVTEFPWFSHKTWSAFFDANSIEAIAFKTQNASEKVIRFYAYLEMLRMRDAEDEEVERLNKRELYEAAENLKRDLGQSKQGLRNELIKVGKEILLSK